MKDISEPPPPPPMSFSGKPLTSDKDLMTYPFLDAASLAQSPLCSRDTVCYTAVAFAKAPELSTHFLGKKAKAS